MDVAVHGLSKSYASGKVQALKEVSLQVNAGELFGLIGPDGAGKTSLFRILTTLLLPDAGEAQVLGLDVVKEYKEIRRRVGYMPGKFSLYADLTVEENLMFFASVFGTTIHENMDLVRDIYSQIEPFKDRRAGKLSGGMKQKLALCCALIHKPEVLFLDEPTTGVDAVSRTEFWNMLGRLKQQGITILVSTPYMDEATRCDRIALIQKGMIMDVDTPNGLMDAFPRALFAVKAEGMIALQRELKSMSQVFSCHAFGEFFHVSFHAEGLMGMDGLRAHLLERGFKEVVVHPIRATVEDCFIDLMVQHA
jgi:ABC-2 type transport system ATP-binding protein